MSDDKAAELGSEIPGLSTAASHIAARLSIAVDDVIDGVHDKEWLLEEMRQDIMYYGWLYLKAGERS